MIRLIIWGLVAYLIYRLVRLFIGPSRGREPAVRNGKPPEKEREKKYPDIFDAKYTDIE